MTFVRFRAGRTWLGWPAGKVREIVALDGIAPLPRAPAHLAGLTSVDGRVVALVDLVPLLQLGADKTPPSRILVVELDGEEVGVLAHEVWGTTECEATENVDALQANQALLDVVRWVGRAADQLLWCVNPSAIHERARSSS